MAMTDGLDFGGAMRALRQAHRGRGYGGHCALNAGSLEDSSQTDQSVKLHGVVNRQNKIGGGGGDWGCFDGMEVSA